MPRATVIIATYNWSSVLPYSIGSAIGQSEPDIEILVIGDGCTDDTEEVLARITDPRVRFINLPEHTGHQARPNNEGLRLAASPVAFYLGHDDVWLPHHVATLLAEIDAGTDVAYGMTVRVSPGDQPLRLAMRPGPYVPLKWLPPTGFAHRLAVTEAVEPWVHRKHTQTSSERELLNRAHKAGFKFGFAPRLTAIKIPASPRPESYQERPSHEQAHWFERVLAEPDLEAKLLAEIIVNAETSARDRRQGGSPLRSFFRRQR